MNNIMAALQKITNKHLKQIVSVSITTNLLEGEGLTGHEASYNKFIGHKHQPLWLRQKRKIFWFDARIHVKHFT